MRRIASSEAVEYQGMAEEFLAAAELCLKTGFKRAAGTNAIHASISASDAVCIFEMGVRSSAPTHDDAVDLLRRSGAPEAKEKAIQFSAVLKLKNLVEYESRPISDSEAETLVKRARRLVEWSGAVLKG
jgi:HEPN domain-containing protein